MPAAERQTLLAEGFQKWTNERNWTIFTFQEEFQHRVLGAKVRVSSFEVPNAFSDYVFGLERSNEFNRS
jgi:hypothetical protein